MSEYSQCKNIGSNSQLAALCSCNDATNLFAGLIQQYNANMASYQRWSSIHNDWKNRTGVYSNYANNTSTPFLYDLTGFGYSHAPGCDWTLNCATCFDSCNYYNAGRTWNTTLCQQQAATMALPFSTTYWFDGTVNDTNCVQVGDGSCGKKQTQFQCSRPQSSMNAVEAAYIAAEPKLDPQTGQVWLGVPAPTPPSNINIQCCTQLFSNITASEADFSNINQQCQQNIHAQINTVAPESSSGSSSSLGLGLGSLGSLGGSGSWMLLVGVVVLLCCCMSSSLVFLAFKGF